MIPEPTLKCWQSYQKFAAEQRARFDASELSPDALESTIRQEWTARQPGDADKRKQQQRDQVCYEDASSHIDSSGGPSLPVDVNAEHTSSQHHNIAHLPLTEAPPHKTRASAPHAAKAKVEVKPVPVV